eukprot:3256386-Rhodomonas_salina.1
MRSIKIRRISRREASAAPLRSRVSAAHATTPPVCACCNPRVAAWNGNAHARAGHGQPHARRRAASR